MHLEHYRGNEEFAKRVYDQIDQMERQQRMIITPFFSPDQIRIVETICGKQTYYVKDGGYVGAERCRFAYMPYEQEVTMPICILCASYSSAYGKLQHRDILGALMNLGIERELLGDLLVSEQDIHILCDREIANYLQCNLTKIKRTTVHFKVVEAELNYEANITYEQRIVSSLRLDALVATLTKVSRSKAQMMIQAGLVKVDHVVLEQSAYLCDNNSAISIRGYGRFEFSKVVKKTKKDHFVIAVGVYQ